MMSEQAWQLQTAVAPEPTVLESNRFYVVSKRKFAILYLATGGAFCVHWMYQNWKCYTRAANSNLWPLPRAMFPLFFTHSLFDKIQTELEKNDSKWDGQRCATYFLLWAVVEQTLGRVAGQNLGSPITDLLSIAILPITMHFLLGAQTAINASMDDEEGLQNDRITAANWAWILLGGAIWVMIISDVAGFLQ